MRVLTRLSQSSISEQATKRLLQHLTNDKSRIMDRVLEMPESKTDAEDAIRLDTLDNITANLDIKHIDLVMMDIEAYEIYALEGMKELLSKKAVKHLIVEVHPEFLQEIGGLMLKLFRYLKTVAIRWTNSIRKAKLLPYPRIFLVLLPFLPIFLFLLILVVVGLRYCLCYRLHYLSKKLSTRTLGMDFSILPHLILLVLQRLTRQATMSGLILNGRIL